MNDTFHCIAVTCQKIMYCTVLLYCPALCCAVLCCAPQARRFGLPVVLVLGLTSSHSGLLQLLPNGLMRRIQLLLLSLPAARQQVALLFRYGWSPLVSTWATCQLVSWSAGFITTRHPALPSLHLAMLQSSYQSCLAGAAGVMCVLYLVAAACVGRCC